jgi:hypothetical protein
MTARVKMRRTRIEHMLSALPPILAVKADIRDRQVRARSSPLRCKVGHRPPDRDTPFSVGCNAVLKPVEAHADQSSKSAGFRHTHWQRDCRLAVRRARATAQAAQYRRPRPRHPEPFWSEFRAGLSQYGYIEGQSIAFELRSADGKPERLRGLAAMQQFVQQREGKACHPDAQRCRIAPGVCQQCAAPKTSVSPTVASCVARSVRKREQQGKRLV